MASPGRKVDIQWRERCRYVEEARRLGSNHLDELAGLSCTRSAGSDPSTVWMHGCSGVFIRESTNGPADSSATHRRWSVDSVQVAALQYEAA
jgi:hypothetical protein